jgi:hypothetical protein
MQVHHAKIKVFRKEVAVKNTMVFVAAICFAFYGFTGKVMAGPVPVSAQEGAQLTALAGCDALLPLKAGGSFPHAPQALEPAEESTLRNMEKGSPGLPTLKAGDGAGTVLVWVIVICVCILLLRAVGV